MVKLRTRWDRGTYLEAHARGAVFDPVSLPVRAPTADDLLARVDEVTRWVQRFDADNRTGRPDQRFAVERRVRRGRVLGDNPVPTRVHVESFPQLCTILDTTVDVARLDRVLALTRAFDRRHPDPPPGDPPPGDPPPGEPPRAGDGVLTTWVTAHPHEAIAHADVWPSLLDVVSWIVDHGPARADLDLRHLDVAGVDTKFVERHRKVLTKLLVQVLPGEEVDRTATTFAGRFGFRARPTHVRFRLLAPVPELPAAITEAELRVDELAALPLSASTVFIVENRATYLAFPDVADALVFFGEGYGVTVLEGLPWLAQRELVYWGDLDTHGFAILDRLRQRVPGVRSLLMDRATLVAHRDRFVVEEHPTDDPLTELGPDEQALYRDLIEDRYGTAVRLEQERIRFSAVRRALSPWTGQ